MKTINRQNPLSLILFCICLFFSISHVSAQDGDVTESPYFNITCSDTTGVAFSLLATNVNATVSGVIANVVIEQTYYNSGDSTVGATYVFPMSSNAAVYGMEMQLNERTIKAEIRRKDEAQTIFDNAEEDGLTASLLEQHRPNVFQMSLANIQAGDTIQVLMRYTELLVPREGIYQFVFPSIVGPRYTTGGEPWVSQSKVDSLAASQTELNVDLQINAGMPLQADCSSHPVVFQYEENSAHTSLSTHPGDDFIVDYTLDGNHIETGLLLYEGEEENFFLSMLQPPRPNIPFESPRREYIFIMDVSGSMRGQPIEISKQMISNLLVDLDYDDRFNIIFFAGGHSVLSQNSLPVTDENIGQALAMIDNINAGGGTQLLPAMQRALDMEATEDFARTFVILTDGYVTVEKESFDLIRKNLNDANFFAFGIGSAVNRYIIEGIAYVGEGEPFIITNYDDADDMASRFKKYIEAPVLTNITTKFTGIDVYDVEPLTIPDVFAERPIIVYGKYKKPADGSITVTGDYADGVLSETFSFPEYQDNIDENIALKYLWARKKIKLMSDYGVASNEQDTVPIEEEITQLGLKYSLVTAYTSFVAVDSNAVTSVEEPGGTTGEGGGGGTVSSTEQLAGVSAGVKKDIIIVLGNVVRSGSSLLLKFEHFDLLSREDLELNITDMNGRVLKKQRLLPADLEGQLEVVLDNMAPAIYFISLSSKNGVIDTRKFMVVK